MRPGEQDGVDYIFVSKEQFELWIEAGEMLEHALVYGQYKVRPPALPLAPGPLCSRASKPRTQAHTVTPISWGGGGLATRALKKRGVDELQSWYSIDCCSLYLITGLGGVLWPNVGCCKCPDNTLVGADW